MKTGQQKGIHSNNYSNIWLLLIDLSAPEGTKFNDLIELDEGDDEEYLGAWANILIKADTFEKALQLAPLGLEELGFEIKEIDTTENLKSLIDDSSVGDDVISEADWLIASDYVFMISDKIFPYIED